MHGPCWRVFWAASESAGWTAGNMLLRNAHRVGSISAALQALAIAGVRVRDDDAKVAVDGSRLPWPLRAAPGQVERFLHAAWPVAQRRTWARSHADHDATSSGVASPQTGLVPCPRCWVALFPKRWPPSRRARTPARFSLARGRRAQECGGASAPGARGRRSRGGPVKEGDGRTANAPLTAELPAERGVPERRAPRAAPSTRGSAKAHKAPQKGAHRGRRRRHCPGPTALPKTTRKQASKPPGRIRVSGTRDGGVANMMIHFGGKCRRVVPCTTKLPPSLAQCEVFTTETTLDPREAQPKTHTHTLNSGPWHTQPWACLPGRLSEPCKS